MKVTLDIKCVWRNRANYDAECTRETHPHCYDAEVKSSGHKYSGNHIFIISNIRYKLGLSDIEIRPIDRFSGYYCDITPQISLLDEALKNPDDSEPLFQAARRGIEYKMQPPVLVPREVLPGRPKPCKWRPPGATEQPPRVIDKPHPRFALGNHVLNRPPLGYRFNIK